MGPSCIVLFEAKLTDGWSESICKDLASLGPLTDNGTGGLDLDVRDATLVGGDDQPTAGPVLVAIESPPSEYDEQALTAFEGAVGFRPRTSLFLGMGCNTADDHRLLGQIGLYFGEKYSGIIDFCGALLPRRLPRRFSFETTPWDAISGRFRAMIADLPGEVWEFPYVAASGKRWVSHAGDPVFLRAWLATPDFHMVK